MPWEAFLYMSGNPLVPTIEEALLKVLSPAERRRVTAHLRPLVEGGIGTFRLARAYLSGVKPG